MTRLGRVTVKKIFVKNDSDPGGKGEIEFHLMLGGAELYIGKYNVESGTTIQINKIFDDIGLYQFSMIGFRGIDDDGNFLDPFAEDRAEHHFNLDRNQFPLPQQDLWIRAVGKDGLNFTVYYSLEHRGVFDGAKLHFECLGNVPGLKYLSSETGPSKIRLTNGDDAKVTTWRAANLGNDHFGFQQVYDGSGWLDGNTVDGSVSLAPHTNSPYTGTHWRVHHVDGDGRVRLECLGNVPGPRWLDGNTINGSIKLVATTGPEHSGTTWRLEG